MEEKTYKVEYICKNCETSVIIDVEFGKPIPILVKDGHVMSQYQRVGPICEYCGCNNWSHGKKPKG